MYDSEFSSKDLDIFYECFGSFEKNKESDYFFNEKEMNNLLKEKISKKRKRENKNYDDIEDIKKEKLKKNAESARKTRQRKKLEIEYLINENKKLKNIIFELENQRTLLCEQCKKKLNIENNKKILFQVSSQKNQNFNTFQNRNIFTIISIIITCIFLIFNVSNISKIKKPKYTRNLSLFETKNNIFEMSNNEIKHINLTYNKFYITLGDYYSIITKKNFLFDKTAVKFLLKNEGIRYLSEDDFFNNNITNCINCIVELGKNNIQYDPIKINRFKLFFYPKDVIHYNGNQNFENNKDEKGNIFQTYFEIDCLAFGYSEHKINEY